MFERIGMRMLAAACLAGALGACAPGIKVARMKPARFNLGATKTVAVLQVNGDANAASQVMVELQRSILDDRYYQLINAVNRGIILQVGGVNARVDVGQAVSQVNADVYLVASVLQQEVVEERRTTEKSERDRTYEVTTIHPTGYAKLNMQVVAADGRVLVFRDYAAEHAGSSYEANKGRRYNRASLIEAAMRKAVRHFVSDITPTRVIEKIVLDDSEPAVKPGVKYAEGGNLNAAWASWQAVLDANPRSAAAVYNQGVLLETRGDFDEAAAAYRKAIAISPKSLYRDALRDLQRRLSEARSLQTPL